MAQQESSEMNRRDFVTGAASAAVGIGVLATACCSALGQATTQPSAAAAEPLDCGPKSDYAKDGPVLTWAKKSVVVVRAEGKIYAMTSKCTHRQCIVDDATDHLNCPCHNSNFSYDGKVISGPARRPLPRYGITVNADGHVIVDTSKTFSEAKWDDTAAFITVA
jgi:cytochrome b6-f complex iron-sulfur subunit